MVPQGEVRPFRVLGGGGGALSGFCIFSIITKAANFYVAFLIFLGKLLSVFASASSILGWS